MRRSMVFAGRPRAALLFAALALLAAFAPVRASAETLRVLVTNDDGVGAAGISAVVAKLAANPNLDVRVYAPLTNQSGTGDKLTATPVAVAPATTMAGYPATSVAGFPADSVTYGVLQALNPKPDFIVSGINFGQNLADVTNASGTVGAALWGARLGIPGIAVSQGLPATNFDDAANYVAEVVEKFRKQKSFRRSMFNRRGLKLPIILNVNFPTCTTGSLRGVKVVSLGRVNQPASYNMIGAGPPETWQLAFTATPYGSNNCASTLTRPTTDLEAMNNGYASVTPMNADLTAPTDLPPRFRFLER